MKNPSKNQWDSEYINIDKPTVPSGQDNYVNTTPMAQESTVDSYANFQPISLSAAEHSHESATEYVNLEFTESNTDHNIGTSDEEPLSHKVSTPSLPFNNATTVSNGSSQSPERPLGNGDITSDEADGITSKNNTPKFLPSAEQTMHTKADVEYENLPTKTPYTTDDPSEYVMLSMVGIGQVTHSQTNPLTTKGYKEIVSIKTPPAATAATPLPLEMATASVSQYEPARGYEDFVPVKTSPPGGSSSLEVTTVNTKPAAAHKEFVPIKTPPADASLPSEITNKPTGEYEDFVPIKTPPTADSSLPPEMLAMTQYPQTAAYKEFVSMKTPPSTAQMSLPSEITNKPVRRGYEEFVPIKTLPSSHTSNSERHSTTEELISHENDEEYSRLQFRDKEDPTISEQSDSATYSTLVHSASTGSSTSDSFYSKLEVSEVSKTGYYDHVSLKDKPQVPSRNLKKPMKLYEPSSNFVTAVIPPLPPRNRTLQRAADSPSSPPPAGPKPVVLPKSVTPPVTPPIGPKPVIRYSQLPSELQYCDIEFTDIGQPKFRPRSKQLTDQSLPSQHDAYAIIDRDASIGLQIALEQKKYDRR